MKVVVLPQTLHDGEVHSIDINSSGHVLTAGADYQIFDWASTKDLQKTTSTRSSPKPIKKYNYHKSCVSTVKWNPQHIDTFASGDVEGNVYINIKSKPQ